MNRPNVRSSTQHELILHLALSGHEPRTLARQFGVTEWTIKRCVARELRRQQRPYWKQLAGRAARAQGSP